MRSACKRAGLTGITFRTLRYTFASWLVMNGTPVFEVSKLLRHASVQMTERYAHLAPASTRTLVQILEGNARSRPLYSPRGR